MKFPFAAKGVSKIFNAEIISLIAALIGGVAMVLSFIAVSGNVDKSTSDTLIILTGAFALVAGIILAVAGIMSIRDKAHSDAYDAMLKECDADIRRLSEEISEITDYNAAIRKRKSEMKNSIELIDEIIGEGAISDTNLRLLVNKIEIGESDGRLKINLNGQFKGHTDLYDDNGGIKETVYTA